MQQNAGEDADQALILKEQENGCLFEHIRTIIILILEKCLFCSERVILLVLAFKFCLHLKLMIDENSTFVTALVVVMNERDFMGRAYLFTTYAYLVLLNYRNRTKMILKLEVREKLNIIIFTFFLFLYIYFVYLSFICMVCNTN